MQHEDRIKEIRERVHEETQNPDLRWAVFNAMDFSLGIVCPQIRATASDLLHEINDLLTKDLVPAQIPADMDNLTELTERSEGLARLSRCLAVLASQLHARQLSLRIGGALRGGYQPCCKPYESWNDRETTPAVDEYIAKDYCKQDSVPAEDDT